MPTQKPTTAGTKENFCRCAEFSMAGISRLQMDAAIITPPAKPVSIRSAERLSFSFKKKTKKAPRVVPKKGMSRARKIDVIFNPGKRMRKRYAPSKRKMPNRKMHSPPIRAMHEWMETA